MVCSQHTQAWFVQTSVDALVHSTLLANGLLDSCVMVCSHQTTALLDCAHSIRRLFVIKSDAEEVFKQTCKLSQWADEEWGQKSSPWQYALRRDRTDNALLHEVVPVAADLLLSSRQT